MSDPLNDSLTTITNPNYHSPSHELSFESRRSSGEVDLDNEVSISHTPTLDLHELDPTIVSAEEQALNAAKTLEADADALMHDDDEADDDETPAQPEEPAIHNHFRIEKTDSEVLLAPPVDVPPVVVHSSPPRAAALPPCRSAPEDFTKTDVPACTDDEKLCLNMDCSDENPVYHCHLFQPIIMSDGLLPTSTDDNVEVPRIINGITAPAIKLQHLKVEDGEEKMDEEQVSQQIINLKLQLMELQASKQEMEKQFEMQRKMYEFAVITQEEMREEKDKLLQEKTEMVRQNEELNARLLHQQQQEASVSSVNDENAAPSYNLPIMISPSKQPAHLRQFIISPIKQYGQKQDAEQEPVSDAPDPPNPRLLLKKNIFDPLTSTAKEYRVFRTSISSILSTYQQEMNNTIQTITDSLRNHPSLNSNLYVNYINEKKLRRKYFNDLLEMNGNIRVYCRVRPLHVDSAMNASRVATENNDNVTKLIDDQTMKHGDKTFEFEKIFGPQATQENIFSSVEPFMNSVIDGYNCCIIAYGQTGSGKTFTMDGQGKGNEGVNLRALSSLFNSLNSRSMEFNYSVKMSSVEIYNENPRDLLIEPSVYRSKHLQTDESKIPKLEIHQDASGHVFIPDLIEKSVSSQQEVYQIMQDYVKVNRATGATSMNENSSRSHSVIFITVETENLETQEKTIGRLVLCDLAGSERVKKSEAVGQALTEAKHINRSLSALGDVISALKKKDPHIPYRNSKLTYLLQEVLSGGSKILMFAQISPSSSDSQESRCTLEFASRVRCVQLGAAKKKNTNNSSLIIKHKQTIKELNEEHKSLVSEIEKLKSTMKEQRDDTLLYKQQQSEFVQSLQNKIASLESELSNGGRTAGRVAPSFTSPTSTDAHAHTRSSTLPLLPSQVSSVPPIPIQLPKFHDMPTSPAREEAAATESQEQDKPYRMTRSVRSSLPGVNLLLSPKASNTVAQPEESTVDDDAANQDENDKENQPVVESDMQVEDVDEPAASNDENAPTHDKENVEVDDGEPRRLSGSKRKDSPDRVDNNQSKRSRVQTVNVTPAKPLQALNSSPNAMLPNKRVTRSSTPKSGFTAPLTPRNTRSRVNVSSINQQSITWNKPASLVSKEDDEDFTSPIQKQVRFGQAETRTITPLSPDVINNKPSILSQYAPIPMTLNSNLESLRIKKKQVKSLGLGQAKRQQVKTGWQKY